MLSGLNSFNLNQFRVKRLFYLLALVVFSTLSLQAAIKSSELKKYLGTVYKKAQSYNQMTSTLAKTHSNRIFAVKALESLKKDAKKLGSLSKNEKSAASQKEMKKMAARIKKIDKALIQRLAQASKPKPKIEKESSSDDLEAQIRFHKEKLEALQKQIPEQTKKINLRPKEEIEHKLKNENFTSALKICDSLIVIKSSDPELHAYKALAHQGLQDYLAARQSIRESLRLQSANSHYWDILGTIQVNLNDGRAAFSAWNEALTLNPGNWSAKMHIAGQLFEEGYIDSAENIYLRAEKAGIKRFESYRGLGVAAAKAHNNVRAKNYFNKALDLQPNNQEILMLLAERYLEEKQYNYAEDFFQRILQLNPKQKEARYFLGKTALDKSDYTRAIYHWEQLYDLDEKYPDITFWLPAAYFIHGEYLQNAGNYSESTRLYQKALRINPRSSRWLAWGNYKVGEDYRHLQDFRDAEKYFKKALELNTRSLESLFALGMMHWDLQNYQGAEEYWSYILEIDPDHEQARSWMTLLQAKTDSE